MTPEEHFQRGLDHLAYAEMDLQAGRPEQIGPRTQLAHAHFTAANSAAVIEGWARIDQQMAGPELPAPAPNGPQ